MIQIFLNLLTNRVQVHYNRNEVKMFKKLIYKVIQRLKKLYEFLDDVYREAYSQIEKEFQERVEHIRRKNKNQFIKKISTIVKLKCYKDTGCEMPDFMAENLAREMFDEAKKCGDLDELNKLKGV